MPSAAHSSSLGALSSSSGQAGVTYGTPYQPYTASSVWNTPIPTNPTLDPNNAAMVAAVLGPGTYNRTGTMQLVVNLAIYSYGQPVYVADGSTPRQSITGSLAFGDGATSTIPWDSSWAANTGADAKVNIFDTTTGYVYEFDGFNDNSGTLSTYYGTRRNYMTEIGDALPPNNEGHGPTGSGLDQVGGMIRVTDIQQGAVNHALSFLTSNPMGPKSSNNYRYPAANCDGYRTEANGLIEGMRIQLDPSVDLDAISGMGVGEKMIAKALQTYGAYCTDNGGDNNMACGFYCEKPTTTPDPYPGVGITSDWFQLSHIPRDKLRVLDASVTPQP